jgi:hypothetical protein
VPLSSATGYSARGGRIGKSGRIDDEDTKVLHRGLADLFEHLTQGLIEDPKLAIGAYRRRSRLGPPA